MTHQKIILCALILCVCAANTARAESVRQKHARAFGDRAWIADMLYEDFQVKRRAAGDNYEHVPVAYREQAIRMELAMTGCLLARHVESAERGKRRQRAILERCGGTKYQWYAALNMALMASGQFPHAFAGQTPLALIPIKTVQRVLRTAIRHANETNYAHIFTRLIVPLLTEACAVGSCGLDDNPH